MSGFELFHFLRPLWLLTLPLLGGTWWLVRRSESENAQTTGLVAPHLRDALTVNRSSRSGLRPVDGVAIALLTLALAAAGPTWSKRPSPWLSETAPLVIAIEVSDSMRSNDLQPTRLDRARFKVLDLIARRTGSRTALIAYAGSAHLVMPPTSDVAVIKPFLESLDPRIMPEPGANASAVLPMASDMLADASATATLLFVNDGFDSADIRALAAFSDQPDAPSMAALVVGSDEGGVALMPDGAPVVDASGARLNTRVDTDVLRRVAREAHMPVIRSAPGESDITSLMRQIESNLRQADDPDAQWHDQAWWLLWPAALPTLLWFRRGWTMQW
jgi:Ca-activated chloride channel family protein